MASCPIDLEQYPIDQPDTDRYRSLVERCATDYERCGSVLLEGFVHSEALEQMVAEATDRLPHAYYHRGSHTPYLQPPDPSFAATHACNTQLRTDVGSIATDLLEPRGALRSMYDWDPLTAFIGNVLGRGSCYRSADPLGAVSVNVFGAGDGHAWHFDEAQLSVTLMLQPAEVGGHFEYVADLRGDGFDDFDGVKRILDGDLDNVQRLALEPGTLSIFSGRHLLHRVSEVAGTAHRLVPVLIYDTEPGSTNSDEVRELFWGRTH